MAKANNKSESAFADLGGVLGAGFSMEMMQDGDELLIVDCSDVYVPEQIRKEFSRDGESTMEEMTASIKKIGVISPVLMRPSNVPGFLYELVAGGRRFKGTIDSGRNTIPALIRRMTDDEVVELQFIENIQRLNLSQMEEASRIQNDLNVLGSVEAVLDKYNKSRSWLSKLLSLLTLPEQASRLVHEGITADVEVIGAVKQIEKIDPAKAKETVEKLKATRGKEDARAIAKKAKEEVKPAKDTTKATPKDTTQTLPGVATVTSYDTKDEKRPPALVPSQSLYRAYQLIFESGNKPKSVIDNMSKEERDSVSEWLESFFRAGMQSKDASRAVIEGFRKGNFSTDGEGAFALVAFLQGADSDVAQFNLLNVLAAVKV